MAASLLERLPFVLSVALAAPLGVATAQEPTVRSTAVVDLSFDEADGPAEDRATAGTAKDAAQPSVGDSRVTSPFWNVRGGRAARLDAAGYRFFQVADSPDLDHPAGTTLSFFFLNLHDATDAAYHGIVAKRQPNDAGSRTNYGLNFQPSSGRLQVYVHDGSGFKVVGFSAAEAFGVRRLSHLTATFRPGDAPEPDADGDADDLEIRLYVNGKPLKPTDAAGGPVTVDAGWVTDVNLAGRLSDTPLTIGASFPKGETVSGLVDEFLLFDRPLSPEEAARLFTEVAGPDAERLTTLETEAAPSATPTIAEVVPRGLQVGATTRLTVTGRNLGPDGTLSLLGLSAGVSVLPESNAERLVADVTVPAEASPTVVRLAVRTPGGVSPPLALPVDRLPQRMIAEAAGVPVPLPAAFTGALSGSDRPQIVFDGKAGQPFVAEVELKRLGGGADPVLELKTDAGTPVDIAWGRSHRGGDPRLATRLPHDGRYVLELHDLAYQAPASPFRLIAGDLRLMDAVIPRAVEAGATRPATAFGPGFDGQPVELVAVTGEPLATVSGPAAAAAHGSLPTVPVSDGRELAEADAAAETVDLAGARLVATYVTGRLAEQGETDRFVFRARPGQALEFRADAEAIGSPVEPVVTVVEGDREIARQASKPGAGAVALNVTPQAADGRIEVRVADRLRGDSSDRHYRLRVAPAGTPTARVTLLEPSILLPRSGRGVTRLRIERSGDVGAVRLIPDEASGVIVEPAVIPAGQPTGEVFVTVAAAPGREIGPTLSLTAEAETPSGPLRRPVRVAPGPAAERFDPARPYFAAPIVAAAAAPAVELVRLPAAALKGVTETVGLRVSGDVPEGYAVRFSLVSDEPPRPNDPNKPEAGTKPLVRLAEDAAVPPGVSDAAVALHVPADVAAGAVNAVVKAEVVPHAWSDRVAAVGYSAPFTLPVAEAIASVEPAGSAALKPGENQVRLTVRRHEGFAQPVRVELRGLPEGYGAPAVDLPADQTETTVPVTVPAVATVGPIPNAELA
ncbi:MAG TPA: LamG-like jellyroll fold domain-containing protein, partial [Planctomycetaceae bacterium]